MRVLAGLRLAGSGAARRLSLAARLAVVPGRARPADAGLPGCGGPGGPANGGYPDFKLL